MNTIKFPSNGLKLVSLFSGCGGSSLGYKMAGYDIRLAVEWNGYAAMSYRKNFPGTVLYEGDIMGLSNDEALNRAQLQPKELDVLDGSPPCQGFSIAGPRIFGDKRNLLFEEYVRLLEAFRPKLFVMENVGGLVKGKMKLYFAAMTKALKNVGYQVSCRMLNAWWYGVPQSRERLIWIGVRNDLEIVPSHPKPLCNKPVTVRTALNLTQNMGLINFWRSDGHINSTDQPSGTLNVMMPHMFWNFSQPKNTKNDLQDARIKPSWQMHRVLIGKERKKHFGLIRLKIDKPSPVILKDAGNTSTGMVHPSELRKLTIPEAKTLQGFPEWFHLEGNYKVQWAQIGNSVPPPMAKAIGRYIAEWITVNG